MNKFEFHKAIFQIHKNFVESNNELEYYRSTCIFFRDFLPELLNEKYFGGMLMISNTSCELSEVNNDDFEIYDKTEIGKMIFSKSWFSPDVEQNRQKLYLDYLMTLGPKLQTTGKTRSLTNSTLKEKWDTTIVYNSKYNNISYCVDNDLNSPLNYFDVSVFPLSKNMLQIFDSIEKNQPIDEHIINYNYPESHEIAEFINRLPRSKDEGFRTINPDLVNRFYGMFDLYATYLQKAKELFDDNLIIYNLRPKILHDHFNGVLFLVVRNELSTEEYIEIEEKLFRIFSETIKLVTEKLTRDAEWKTIVDEMTHSTRTELGTLQGAILNAESSLTNGDLQDAKSRILIAKALSSRLNEINSFIFALMKSGLEPTRMDENVKESLAQDDNINLNEIITSCINTLKDSLRVIKLSKESHRTNISIELDELKKDVSKMFWKVKLKGCKNGIRIILMDLLKNAARFTDENNPKIEILLSKPHNSEFYELHFINNSQISEEGFNFIKYGKNTSEWSKSDKVGWRVINKILDYERLGSGSIKWTYDIDERSKTTPRTDIWLKIPKNDLYE